MQRIRVLAEDTINKIAAGEVIENPAAVVKELVENAIDAGAQSICVSLVNGGFTALIISDDGCGMGRDDALLSIERHATSKIANAEDLETVATMGFRGEALASIASIAKFRMLTCSKDDQIGTEIVIDGGKLRFAGDGAREAGTTIEVKQLFYNVPARRKFQKSPSTSTTQIVRKMTDLALAHPHLQFELICDGKERLSTSGKGFDETIKELLGLPYFDQTVAIDTEYVKGRLGKPLANRPTRSGQYLFINGRSVECPLLVEAIKEGYGTRLGVHQYPIFALQLSFPFEWIDVNVHPQKKEIRFYDEKKVSALVRNSIADSFAPQPKQPITPMSWDHAYEEMELTLCERPQMELEFERLPIIGLLSPYLILAAQHSPLRDENKAPTGFVLVHLKRAEERIFYDAMLSGEGFEKEMQGLMLPITLECDYMQAAAIERHMDVLQKCGIGVRQFGDKAFVVDALHTQIEPDSVPVLIDRLLLVINKMDVESALDKLPKLIPRRIPYSQSEAERLVFDLLKTQDTRLTPTGEPIFTHVDLEDVESLFKTA